MKFLKPKIIISKCLEFDACRYDGQLINNNHINKLKPFIDFIPVCPEVEIGMGTPRETIKIVENKNETLLYQSATKKDFNDKMNSFSKKYLNNVENIDGFILKSKSPSCGYKSAKIYPKKNNASALKKGDGIFTRNILSKFPNHPIEEEKRLNNIHIREHFLTCIFTVADFKTVNNFNTLYRYHAKHKYLFMSYNQTLMSKMGNIAANEKNENFNLIKNKYFKSLLILLSKKSRYKSNINTQMHVLGYFKNLLTSKEKKHFLDKLELYRKRKIPISSVNNILHSWIYRFENKYLMNQSFFNPFPEDLIYKDTSRFE
tara:strand:- start:84 stop:1031 length:948 start_codon:yes stop_codon:yes gene_type:complete